MWLIRSEELFGFINKRTWDQNWKKKIGYFPNAAATTSSHNSQVAWQIDFFL